MRSRPSLAERTVLQNVIRDILAGKITFHFHNFDEVVQPSTVFTTSISKLIDDFYFHYQFLCRLHKSYCAPIPHAVTTILSIGERLHTQPGLLDDAICMQLSALIQLSRTPEFKEISNFIPVEITNIAETIVLETEYLLLFKLKDKIEALVETVRKENEAQALSELSASLYQQLNVTTPTTSSPKVLPDIQNESLKQLILNIQNGSVKFLDFEIRKSNEQPYFTPVTQFINGFFFTFHDEVMQLDPILRKNTKGMIDAGTTLQYQTHLMPTIICTQLLTVVHFAHLIPKLRTLVPQEILELEEVILEEGAHAIERLAEAYNNFTLEVQLARSALESSTTTTTTNTTANTTTSTTSRTTTTAATSTSTQTTHAVATAATTSSSIEKNAKPSQDGLFSGTVSIMSILSQLLTGLLDIESYKKIALLYDHPFIMPLARDEQMTLDGLKDRRLVLHHLFAFFVSTHQCFAAMCDQVQAKEYTAPLQACQLIKQFMQLLSSIEQDDNKLLCQYLCLLFAFKNQFPENGNCEYAFSSDISLVKTLEQNFSLIFKRSIATIENALKKSAINDVEMLNIYNEVDANYSSFSNSQIENKPEQQSLNSKW